MVKPPKTMQPEGMDLSKAGRTSRKSFGQDSFHLYMARKIDMQRQQFGVILPPPPLPSPPPAQQPIEATNEPRTMRMSPTKSPASLRPHSSQTQPILRRKHPTKKPPSLSSAASFSSPTKTRPRNVVRFSPSTKRGEDDEERRNRKRKAKETARQERESAKKRAGGDASAMGSILERLQQRHGDGDSQHRARKKRKRVPGVLPRIAPPEMRDFASAHVSIASRHPNRSSLSSSFTMVPSIETVNVQSRHLHVSSDLDDEKKAALASETLHVDEDTSSHQDASLIETKKSPQHKPTSSTKYPSPLLSQRLTRPDLFFLGIVIKINGYTDPDNETLKRLIQKHGGDFETYETTRVTHLIAGQLSKAKSDMYKKQRSPRPVCLPSWIVESVRAGRLLPPAEYGLTDMKHDPRQAGLSTFFGRKEEDIVETQHQSLRIFGDYEEFVEYSTSPPSDQEKEPQPTTFDSSRNEAEDEGGKVVEEESSSEAYITESDESLVRQSHFTAGSTEFVKGKQLYLVPSIREYGDPSINSVEDNAIIDTCIESVPMTSKTSILEKVQVSGRPTSFTTKVFDASHQAIHDDPEENPGLDNLQQYGTETCNSEEYEAALASAGAQNSDKELASDNLAKPTRNRTEGQYINGKIRTTGTDPNFLDSFFSASRLSFIGSYKQRTTATTVTSPSKAHVGNTKSKRLVFHIDMDCFFASVVLRNFPEHRDKPVAISHQGQRISNSGAGRGGGGGEHKDPSGVPVSKNSTSECATCNYKAREYGIKKGMFLGRAKQLCPELVVLQYDFDGYEEVTEQVMEILYRVTSEHKGVVEAVSCDEAYMELHIEDDDGKAEARAGELAETIRVEIFEMTQCTASIGVATNKFLAKLGTDQVKPNGSFVVQEYKKLLDGLKLRDLHGIGWRSEPKLSLEGLVEVRDVWDLGHRGEATLSRILGPGLGKRVYMYCQGEDDRQVKPAERKTIGAECNYGVRFDGPYGVDYMINGLAKEVQKRMEGEGVRGRRLTLKLKQRKKGAKPPPKFLGHGSCHNFSKSRDLPGSLATRDATIFGRVALELFSELAVPVDDVRGMGIVVSKLDNDQSIEVETAPSNRITSWFKKNGPSEKGLQTKDVGSRTIDSTQVSTMQKCVDVVECVGDMVSTSQDVPLNASQRETFYHPGCQKMNSGKNDVISDLPPHFQDEIMDYDEDEDEIDDSDEDSSSLSSEVGIGNFHLKDVRPTDSSLPADEEAEQYPDLKAPPPSTQIELPPLSQLHMSQVEALPPKLRRQIMARIDTSEFYRDSSKGQQEVIFIHEQEGGSVTETGMVTGRDAERKRSTKQIHSSAPLSPDHDSAAARFRQTSLTRMMRLAAVKSGVVETAISLTQLDHLPLELQLQVVNDDLGPIGALSPTKLPHPQANSHKEISKSEPQATHANEVSGLKNGNDSVMMARQRDSTTDVLWSEILSMEVDIPPTEEKDTHETEEEDEEEEDDDFEILVTLPPRDQRAFFRENVAPLNVFLDENPPSNKEAVETVISFLCQCVTEGQLRDVVILFRSIRNRVDSWSDIHVLEQLTQALDERHFEIYKNRLDVDWLLGR